MAPGISVPTAFFSLEDSGQAESTKTLVGVAVERCHESHPGISKRGSILSELAEFPLPRPACHAYMLSWPGKLYNSPPALLLLTCRRRTHQRNIENR